MTTPQPLAVATPSIWVREIADKDGAALLDIKQGICFSMTPIGTLIWHQLKLGQPPRKIAEYLARSFPDVAQEEIYDDVLQFIAQLEKKRILVEHTGGPTSAARIPVLVAFLTYRYRRQGAGRTTVEKPRRLFWKALVGLLIFDLLGVYNNFAGIHRLVQQWPVAIRPSSPEIVNWVTRAINHACAWYPKRVRCLQRSVVTACLLRSCGVHAKMVLGAQKFPFKAHAWTEVNGRPINERRDVHNIYLVWERC